LNGATSKNSWRWSVGDIKAYLYLTATPLLFMVKWYLGDKTIKESIFISFDKSFMKGVLIIKEK
jgi:hypothetical protein